MKESIIYLAAGLLAIIGAMDIISGHIARAVVMLLGAGLLTAISRD